MHDGFAYCLFCKWEWLGGCFWSWMAAYTATGGYLQTNASSKAWKQTLNPTTARGLPTPAETICGWVQPGRQGSTWLFLTLSIMELSGFQIKKGWSWKYLGQGRSDKLSMSSGWGGWRHRETMFMRCLTGRDPGYRPQFCLHPHPLLLWTAPVKQLLVIVGREWRSRRSCWLYYCYKTQSTELVT